MNDGEMTDAERLERESLRQFGEIVIMEDVVGFFATLLRNMLEITVNPGLRHVIEQQKALKKISLFKKKKRATQQADLEECRLDSMTEHNDLLSLLYKLALMREKLNKQKGRLNSHPESSNLYNAIGQGNEQLRQINLTIEEIERRFERFHTV
jgi:hypothetical protein